MSTNRERLTKGIIDFVNQECVMGSEYWMRRIEFEIDLEKFLKQNEYDITWLTPLKMDEGLTPGNKIIHYPTQQYSLSAELIRLYPEIKRERRRNTPGLRGVASRVMKGATFNDFIKSCIVFNPESRSSNKEIGKGLFVFTDGLCRDEKLSMSVVNKAIMKKAAEGGHQVEQIMYNDKGKTVRGIKGIEVEYE